jgi:hypothetical protein
VLLQSNQGCTCPPTNAATATCNQGSQTEKDNLLRAALQYCALTGYDPSTCCPNMPINDNTKWPLWQACLW